MCGLDRALIGWRRCSTEPETITIDVVVGTALIQTGYAELVSGPFREHPRSRTELAA
jgi:hypothetical protein